jgi:hypothetical protein
LNDSPKNRDFDEKTQEITDAQPSYFAQIVDIHPKGNYSCDLEFLRIGWHDSRSDIPPESMGSIDPWPACSNRHCETYYKATADAFPKSIPSTHSDLRRTGHRSELGVVGFLPRKQQQQQ